MRLFIGIPLPPGVVRELAAVVSRLRSKEDGLRWSAPETWHITLQFLGNTRQDAFDCLVPRLRAVGAPPVRIGLEGLGSFDRAGVFFALVGVTRDLLALQEQVVLATRSCGFNEEARPFQPHITMARSKGRRQGVGELVSRMQMQPRLSAFVAEEFVLYESFLGSAGARHEVRERFSLVRERPM
jgi:2'-5' RNA ligase